MRRKIEGCRAIVTGASSGIGRALALEFARRGAKVLATARRAERLAELAKEAGSSSPILTLAGDVTSEQTRAALIETARSTWGGLDLLVNNAGVGVIRDFERSAPEQFRQVMDVNLFAPVELIRAALPSLKAARQPLIVNVASVLGHRGVPHYSEYCASKFALVGFSESLRAELAGEGIDVLVVSPGPTKSEFWQSLVDEQAGVGSRGEGAIPVEKVAREIVRAIVRGRHLIVPNTQGRLLLLLNRISPRLADAAVARFG